MRHFDVQILGGIVLHRGNIAEMVTGEGKTLVATLPAYLNALEGKGVHVVTVNDYLARRDCEWMLPIYQALGITAGYIQSDMDPVARRKAYDCDITYGTNSEFGFDYLRDNMKPARWGDPELSIRIISRCQKPSTYAIIDEVDNILIDEARTPLIISGPAFSDLRRYAKANDIAVQLTDLQKQEPGKYFEVKEKEHTCHLTDEGIRKAEELAGVESFYTAGNMEWPHLIDNALKAHHLYKQGQAVRRDAPPRDRRDEHHHRRRVHRPSDARPAVVATACTRPSRPSTPRRRQDQGRDADAGHHHAAKLLQALQEAGRHDRHGHDRGRRVLEDLQARSHRHPDQQAADPRQSSRRDLPHREGEVGGGRRGDRRGPRGRPADPDRHDRRRQVDQAQRHAQAPRHQARAAQRQAGTRGPRGRDRRPGRPHRRA